MAYRYRRRRSYGSRRRGFSTARRGYGRRRMSYGRRRRASSRARGTRTVRIVVQSVPASPVALGMKAVAPLRARF